jgi:hypothetical protein
MLRAASYLSVFLYLVPLVTVAVLRSRRGREPWEIALDIPFAVALDLLGLLALARLMHLETAVLVSRPLWFLGGLAVVLRRRRSGRPWPTWPAAIDLRALARVSLCVALAVALSMVISRPCLNVDRRWHIPLVASLRGQTVPFHNVYDPGGLLAYHYAGDVLAAELQTLSGAVLHASLALSLAHDLVFGLTAAAVALLFLRRGGRWQTALVVAPSLGFLLAGPITFVFGHHGVVGYSYTNFLRISYRPHTSLAALFLTGFLGSVWVRLRGGMHAERVSVVKTWPVLLACTAALALTDEASVALLGLSLGVAWLVEPDVVHPRRLAGAGVFVGLLGVLVGTVLLFGGSLSPGAPVQQVHLTPWRVSGYQHKPVLLGTLLGVELLFRDTVCLLAVWVAGAIVVARERRRALGLFVLFTTLAVVSWVLLARVEVAGSAEEGHRFVTVAMLATPLFGFWWLLRARAHSGVGSGRVLRTLAPLLAVSSVGLSAISTLLWLGLAAPQHCDRPSAVFSQDDFHGMDCRERYGAQLGEDATPRYVTRPLAYGYEGCHPVFAPTSQQLGQYWAVATGTPTFGQEGLRTLHETMVGEGELLEATCPPDQPEEDPVCLFGPAQGGCREQGTGARTCALSADDRRAILAEKPLKE